MISRVQLNLRKAMISGKLNATNFITPEGKLWWFRSGSFPFTDMKFLKGEIERAATLRKAK